MKQIATLILCCLAMLGFCQSSNSPLLANPLPIGKVVASGNDFAVQTSEKIIPVYFNGTSVAGDALNWGTPAEFAARCESEGLNLIRFHHFDAVSVDRLVALADALYAKGIYFCFDIVGDRWMNRKVEVYEGGAIRNEMIAEMDRLKPLLRHSGLAYTGLVNEGATPLKGKYNANFARCVEICNETYGWFKARLAERGYTGLVGDLPDANIDSRFGHIVAKQDILLVHGYGTHNNGQQWKPENWAVTYVHIGSIVNHINNYGRKIEAVIAPPPLVADNEVDLVPAPKPAIIQEFACMFPNPDRGMNEMLWRLDFFRRGYSVCSYAMATNQSQLRGTHTEIHDFAWMTDPARRNAQIAGALLVKYGKGPLLDYYFGGAIWPGPVADPNVRFATDKVSVKLDKDRGLMQVKAGYKKLLYVSLDQTLVRGFASIDAGNGWRQTTARGGLTFGAWIPKPIDVGAPVSGAYQDGVTLRKDGNLVYPIGPGMVTVNLK